MKLGQLLSAMQSIAPEHLAESWDKVGLQLGDPSWSVQQAVLCIDLTADVLAEAIDLKAQLVVAYHPPMFKPVTSLTPADPKGQLLLEAACSGVAIYSPHTALDAAPGGVNDWLAAMFNPASVDAIKPAAGPALTKVVVFTPVDHADAVRDAMSAAGAGRVGAYGRCSFSAAGEGAFEGDATTNPTIGKPGAYERVQEMRVEMVCPPAKLPAVVRAIHQSHPYEEPAFDIYPLQPWPADHRGPATGQGRVFDLPAPMSLAAAADVVKRRLGVNHLEMTGDGGRTIRRVALCAGSGGSLLDEAGDIDLFITGEMRHHDMLAAAGRGVSLLLAGHTQTERPFLSDYRDQLAAAAPDVAWRISQRDAAPSVIV